MITLILENIRSMHNVGSIFRTADATGVSHVYLSGITPTPLDRFGRARKDITKASLGAEVMIPWSAIESTVALIEKLKKDNYTIIALEQAPRAIKYTEYHTKPDEKIALILGNEVTGIDRETLARADVVLEIPMHGKKESLNVSVAAGVVLFALIDR